MTQIPGYYSSEELQKLLGVSKQRVNNLAREQGWHGERVGVLYPAEQVEKYLEERNNRMRSTVNLSESGYDTGLTFDEACDLVERAGIDSPRELGYTEEQVTWLGSEYAQSTEDKDWPDGVPYWYVPASRL